MGGSLRMPEDQKDQTKDKDVNITYETLFELLRREKSREDLQELPETFFEDVVEYLKDKSRVTRSSQENAFSEEEMEKARVQLANIKRIVRELYERREKKIISMALNKSRTKSNLVNTSALLREENKLYDDLRKIMDFFREGILSNVLAEKTPETSGKSPADAGAGGDGQESPSTPESGPEGAENSVPEPKELKKEAVPNTKTKTIRFIKPVPKFAGSDLRIYGPFDEEDIARLPEDVADVLINKGRAEAMESQNTPA
ncbi:MAG: hypothetical protein R6U32_03405 [Candidatus Woesearchaeota archaeon]